MAGANAVTIHDGTPVGLKRHFPIYSIKRFTPDEERIRNIVLRADLFLDENNLGSNKISSFPDL